MPPPATITITCTYQYPLPLCKALKEFNFEDQEQWIPKHILGFSADFGLTWKCFRKYEEDFIYGKIDPSMEQNKWDALSPLQQQACERNIELLKEQQAFLKAQEQQQPQAVSPFAIQQRPPSRPAASPVAVRSMLQLVVGQSVAASTSGTVLQPAGRSAAASASGTKRSRDEKTTVPGATKKKRKNPSQKGTEQHTMSAYNLSKTLSGSTKKRKSKGTKVDQPLWSSEEERKLLKGRQENLSFQAISEKYFPDGSRTGPACNSRWKKLKQKKARHASSSDEESDDESQEKWNGKGKSGNSGKGDLKSSGLPWTTKEEKKLMIGKNKLHLTFQQIADKFFPNGRRTAKACESHWHKLMQRKHEAKQLDTAFNDSSDEEEFDFHVAEHDDSMRRQTSAREQKQARNDGDGDSDSNSDASDYEETISHQAPKQKSTKQPDWDPDEQEILIKAILDDGKSFREAASLFPTRTESACRNRLNKLQTLDDRVRVWWKLNRNPTKYTVDDSSEREETDEDEDEEDIRRLQKSDRPARKAKVTDMFATTAQNQFDVSGDWTPAENKKLLEAVKEHGMSFRVIARKYFANSRTERQCWNRFEELKQLNTDGTTMGRIWTAEEDEKVRQMYAKGYRWNHIAAEIPYCSYKDIRDHYASILESDSSESKEEEKEQGETKASAIKNESGDEEFEFQEADDGSDGKEVLDEDFKQIEIDSSYPVADKHLEEHPFNDLNKGKEGSDMDIREDESKDDDGLSAKQYEAADVESSPETEVKEAPLTPRQVILSMRQSSFKRGPIQSWTEAEVNCINDKRMDLRNNWEAIAKFLPGRSSEEVRRFCEENPSVNPLSSRWSSG